MKKLKKMMPTYRQIELAKRLGIADPIAYTRSELAKEIERRVKTTKNFCKTRTQEQENDKLKEKEVSLEVVQEDVYPLEEFPGYTNIKKEIIITIHKKKNKKTLQLLKKKKLYNNSPPLIFKLIEFLVRIGAKNKEDIIEIITGNDESVYSPSYIMSVLDGFFISYSWRYIE